jgi:hypothetical protein
MTYEIDVGDHDRVRFCKNVLLGVQEPKCSVSRIFGNRHVHVTFENNRKRSFATSKEAHDWKRRVLCALAKESQKFRVFDDATEAWRRVERLPLDDDIKTKMRVQLLRIAAETKGTFEYVD